MIDELIANGKFADAIAALFATAVKNELTVIDENNMCYALNCFTSDLQKSSHNEQAVWLWEQAIHLVPSSTLLMYNFGKYMVDDNNLLKAVTCFNDCVARDSSFHLAKLANDDVKAMMVDSWHFRMLNDYSRNNAFCRALQHVVDRIRAQRSSNPASSITVLDIGGGTGLLAMFAIRAGADHAYCCEVNPNMCTIATMCIAANGYTGKVTMIPKYSTDVTLITVENPIGDINYPVDIIVSELVDSGLLGEHIISVLRDANTRLRKPDGITIPHSAQVFGELIHSEAIAHRQHIVPCRENDTSLSSVPMENFMEHFSIFQLAHQYSLDEQYTCDSLSKIPHSKLTKMMPLQHVSFSRGCVSGESIVSFSCVKSGDVSALVCWFHMYLLDPLVFGGEWRNSVISTSPYVEEAPGDNSVSCSFVYADGISGWDQAFFFGVKISTTAARSTDSVPLVKALAEGEYYQLRCSHDDDSLEFLWVCDEESAVKPLSMSANLSDTEGQRTIGEMDFACLNNHYFMYKLYQSICVNIDRHVSLVCDRPLRCLELSSQWNSLSLLTLFQQYQLDRASDSVESHQVLPPVSGWCIVSPSDESYISLLSATKRIFSTCTTHPPSVMSNDWNDLSLDGNDIEVCQTSVCLSTSENHFQKVTLTSEPLVSFSSKCQKDFLNWLPKLSTSDKSPQESSDLFDILLCGDIIEGSGLIRQNYLRDIKLACQFLMNLSPLLIPAVLIVPYSITVWFCLIESEDIIRLNRVEDSNTVGIAVSGPLNGVGSCYQLREIDLNNLTHMRYLSEPVAGWTLPLDALRHMEEDNMLAEEYVPLPRCTLDLPVCAPGGPGGMEITSEHSLQGHMSGIVHGVCYWFSISMSPPEQGAKHSHGSASSTHIGDSNVVSTGPYDSAHSDGLPPHHFRQAVFTLESPRAVSSGDVVTVSSGCNLSVGVTCTVHDPPAIG